MNCCFSLAHFFAIRPEASDDFEFAAFESLLDEVFGGKAHAAGLFAKLEGNTRLAVPAAVDESGAGEAISLAEVESKVVELADMSKGAFGGAVTHRGAHFRSQNEEGVDGKGFTEMAKFHAVLFGFDDISLAVAKLTHEEGGMGPESREKEIAEGVAMAGDDDVARFE